MGIVWAFDFMVQGGYYILLYCEYRLYYMIIDEAGIKSICFKFILFVFPLCLILN
jgi:hypothetical protein